MAEPPDEPLDGHLRNAAPGDSLDRRVVLAKVMSNMGVRADAPPATIGRFRVIARLGSGGMGTVYAAHDPRLDRRVAIKLLHDSADPERRLAREAQTLARLQHANIVAVHEIGDVDGREFVAMELVDGSDLGAWMRETPRTWREIVGCFVAAGRGLAAAHAAGVVHRDFKPENVLVARDAGGAIGRVCVADFGLAGVRDPSEGPYEATADVVGTPAFMAPEVGSRGSATAQSDQYSFCVALAEALWGERSSRRPASPKRMPPVIAIDSAPLRVRSIVRRGLSHEPAARWPSMTALCDALARSLRPRRMPAIVVVTAFVAITGAAALARPPVAQACARQADALDRAWQELGRDATLAAGTGEHPAWPAAATWVTDRIDALVPAITTRRQQLCGAPDPEAAPIVRQDACLELVELGISVALERWFEHDLPALEHVFGLIPTMFEVEACDDIGLFAQEVTPSDDETAERVRAVRLALNRASVRARLRDRDAEASLEAVLDEARRIDHPPTTALVLIGLANAMTQAGEPKAAIRWLREAVVEAERGRSDARRIAALDLLARRLADVAELDAAREALAQADAAHARGGASEAAELYAELRHGYVEYAAGDATRALAHYSRAIERARALGPIEDDSLYEALTGIGVLEQDLQRFDSARAHLREALALIEGLLGPEHPMLASGLIAIAACDYYEGELAAADAGFRRALALRVRVSGPDDPRHAPLLSNLAAIDFSRGHYREALEEFRRVLAMRQLQLGADNPENAKFMINISYCLGRLGDHAGAYESAMAAVRLREVKLGELHPLSGKAHHPAGLAALRAGDRPAARQHFEQAIRVARAVPVEADVYEPLVGLTDILLAEGDHAALVRLVEPVMPGCAKADAPYADCALLEFAMARATVATQRGRALELARSAHAKLVGEDVALAEARASIEAWLAQNGR